MNWFQKIPDWAKIVTGILVLFTTIGAFVVWLRENSLLALLISIVLIWILAIGLLMNFAFSKKVIYESKVPLKTREEWKYKDQRPYFFAAIGLFILAAIIAMIIPKNRELAGQAIWGTPTSTPTVTVIPTSTASPTLSPSTTPTQTPTITASPTFTLSPTPLDIRVVGDSYGEDFCYFLMDYQLHEEKSTLDIAINNQSNRDIILASVVLTPTNISVEPFIAGELEVTQEYSVSVHTWVEYYAHKLLGETGWKLEPIYVTEMSQNKYTILKDEQERIQIHLGVDPNQWRDDYELMGEVELYIELDSGDVIKSNPIEIVLCGSKVSESSVVDIYFYEAMDLLWQDKIEQALVPIQKIRDQYRQDYDNKTNNEEINRSVVFALHDFCWEGSVRGYADDVLGICESYAALSTGEQIHQLEARGLARALTGDLSGALADFKEYLEWARASINEEKIALWETWINDLENGVNPFTDEILEILRTW
jgi:hypothetical protein